MFQWLKKLFEHKPVYEVYCSCDDGCNKCMGTFWAPVDKDTYDATPERDRRVDHPDDYWGY